MIPLRLGAAVVALVLAALQAWSGRHAANADGISYLDLGDAFARGDLANAVNAHWSPAYPALLGVVLRLTQPGAYWEFAVAHAVNLGIFAATLFAYDRLLGQLHADAEEQPGLLRPIPAWAWYSLGYLLFGWATLQLITVRVLSPDMAVAATVFAAAALIVAIRRGQRGMTTFVALGVTLGVGYLVKAPFFPLAFVFLTAAGVAVRDWRQAVPRVAVSCAVFAIIGGPNVATLSLAKGRLTFGESGRLAYAWFVDEVPLRHWQGGEPAGGVANHPTRRIGNAPAVYEFSTPIAGSYPVWYDPWYWYDGIEPNWSLGRLRRTLARNAVDLMDLAVSKVQGTLVLLCLVVVGLGRSASASLAALRRNLDLSLPVLAGLAAYSATGVLPRYLAPFLSLLWLIVLASLRRPVPGLSPAWAAAVAVLVLTLAQELGPETVDGAADLVRGEVAGEHVLHDVAAGLNRAGVPSGASVAAIHPPPPRQSWIGMSGWARLARVRIVAEIIPEDAMSYWQGPASARDRALHDMAAIGARAAVTMSVPAGADLDGWERIGTTVYYLRRIEPAAVAGDVHE